MAGDSAAGRAAPGPVVRAVPLPPVAVHACPTLLCPRNDAVEAMFNQLGSAIAVSDNSQRELLQGVPCMMGPFYRMLVSITSWLGERGVPLEASGPYVSQLFAAIVRDAVHAGPAGFEGLVAEQTPGGLNEGAIRQLDEAGVWTAYGEALNTIYSRSTGKDPEAAKTSAAKSDAAGASSL